MSTGVVITLIVLAVAGLGFMFLAGSLIEVLDSGHIMVIQYPRGELKVAVEPGPYAQLFGSVTKYQKRDQFLFQCPSKQGDVDTSLPITFNDGGRGRACGEIAWEMPIDPKNVIALHTRYRSHEAIETQLVRPVVAKSVTFSGPLMSSTESYAARRGDLLAYLEDQIRDGVYKTESTQVRVKDSMTGVERTVTQVAFVKDAKGNNLRQDNSPLDDFGIKTFNLVVRDIMYDATVENQIKQQQQAVAQVSTAIAKAKEAEQQAITAEQEGRALAAKAKWKQEEVKATEVTAAEMRKRVAELDAEAAAQTKRKEILLGEGEAERRRLAMTADGALNQKLDGIVKINGLWADAFARFQGNVVPQIVTGSAGTGGNAAIGFMELLGMKAARDLAVDLSVGAPPKATKKSDKSE